MASHCKIRRLILKLARDVEYLVCKVVRNIVPIFVGAGNAEIPRSCVVKEIPYIFKVFSSEPGIRLFPKRIHVLIEMTGRVNSVEGEQHRINYAGFGKVETRRFRARE